MLLIPSTDISKRPAPRYYSSTLYCGGVYKEKALGKKHSRSWAELSEAAACSSAAAGVLPPRHTHYAPPPHLSHAQVRQRCHHGRSCTPRQPGKSAAKKEKHLTSVSPKIQLRIREIYTLHQPPQKTAKITAMLQASTSSPCLDLSGWRSRTWHLQTCAKMSLLQGDRLHGNRLMEGLF